MLTPTSALLTVDPLTSAPPALAPSPTLAAYTSPASTAAATASPPPPIKTPIAIPVLNYHSISDSEPGNSAVMPVAKFEEQLAYFARAGYTPLTLADYVAVLEGTKPGPAKPILLTFDDGYADNYTNAMPLLQQYGFPATLFMSPGTVDDPYYLSWEQVDQLQAAGWDIQPHGMTHPHLPQLDAAQQEAEIAESKRLIEARYGTAAYVYCYPYGERNAATLKLLASHRYRYAFTIEQGRSTNEQSAYELKRIFVNGNEGLPELVRKLNWK
ncbi:polysaccharide deacetylase family protein [Paenibacillus cymbidii]|uniref:polysaccharide deacetylase family protein n=1 Tax=Paenibacillus cymbidii TaxID=1639034 RepID=UPI0010803CF9|nr:polysaccharide deacetylase family protein [Paenibacillus cymbidii]